MEQGAHSAPEPCVDELPSSFPLKCILYDALSSAVTVNVYEDNLEVLIVLLLVPVQHVEMLSQLLRAPELVHVYEGVVRRHPPVLRQGGAHHYRQHVTPVKNRNYISMLYFWVVLVCPVTLQV